MCREYKLIACLNWCISCYPAPTVNLIRFADDKFLKFYSCSHKNAQNDRIYVSVEIV